MVLLLAEKEDYSTNLVEQWLNFYEAPYHRVNSEDIVNSIFVCIKDEGIECTLEIEGEKIDVDEFSSVLLRRTHLSYSTDIKELDIEENIKIDITKHLMDEWEEFASFFYSLVKDTVRFFGNNNKINKLKLLMIAKKKGVNIPDTYIINKKEHIPLNEELITKSIKDNISISKGENVFFNYTSRCPNLGEIPLTFFPSLIQEKVDKLFEIRSFFFNNTFFSMAIFSRNLDNSIVDYRDYSNSENAYTPYSLPKEIEQTFRELIREIGLNTCSLDIMVDKKMRYNLLEINVEGQFNWVSYECNYNIEKIIAQTLIDGFEKKG